MSILTRLRAQARYNVLTPIFLLSLGAASPALAATVVIDTPTEDVEILTDDSLINRSDITSDARQAVYAAEDIGSITNEVGASITGGAYSAIYLVGSADSITNAGFIGSTDDYGIYIEGGLREFTNSGTIDAYYGALYVDEDLDNFTNTNEIVSSARIAVSIGGEVKSFTNSGNIAGDEGGVVFGGHVTDFTNTGAISSDDEAGVYFDAGVGTLKTGNGDIDSYIEAEGTAIYVYGNAGSIHNTSIVESFASSAIVVEDGHVTSFTNDGLVHASFNDPSIITNHGASFYSAGIITNNAYIFSQSGDGISVTSDVENIINNPYFIEGTLSGIFATNNGITVGGNLTNLQNNAGITGGNIAVDVVGNLDNLTNTSFILGGDGGVNVGGNIITFDNSGDIYASNGYGVQIGGGLGTFKNSGEIDAVTTAIKADDYITSFTNSGEITSTNGYGIFTNGDVGSFENANLISAYATAVYIDGEARNFTNSGTISGYKGVYIGLGYAHVTNSGTIESTVGLKALEFNGDNNTLAIETGARFVGQVDFGGGANSYLDARDFHGSIAIDVTANSLDMGNVYAGDNYYYQSNESVQIVGGGFIKQSSQPVINLVSGLGELVTTKLAVGDIVTSSGDASMSYVARPQTQAEAATRDAMAPQQTGTTYWADTIGGFGRNADAETGDSYAALVAGAHTQVTTDLRLGVLGGFAQTHLDIGSGSHVIKSTTGVVGVYGSYDMGGLNTDFSLIGGISGNDSDRTIQTSPAELVASASYGGWFIAPTVGAYLPVLSTETGEVSVGGKLGYLAGGFSGYTETGTGLGVTVDPQTYGVFTALLEVRGENAVSDTVTINGSLGVFAQNQSGNAVNVMLNDLAVPLIGPDSVGGSSMGVKAGVGAEVALSDAFNITAGVTGNWRSSGTIAASANLGIGGKF